MASKLTVIAPHPGTRREFRPILDRNNLLYEFVAFHQIDAFPPGATTFETNPLISIGKAALRCKTDDIAIWKTFFFAIGKVPIGVSVHRQLLDSFN